MRLAWKDFVLAGLLTAAVSSSDALGFSEQLAEVKFENERRPTCEFQLLNLNLDSFVHLGA